MIRKDALAAILGSPIAYYAVFAKALGCVEAGVFTSQMFYWYGKGHDPEGWIYKTQDDIANETGLTRRNQEMARRKMREAGVLEEDKRGVPAKLYYRLNMERLVEVVQEYLDAEAAAASPQTPAPGDDDAPAPPAPPTQSDAPPEVDATADLPPPPAQIAAPPEVDAPPADPTNKDVQNAHPRMSKTRILESANRTSKDVQTVHAGMRELDIQASANWTDKDARFGRANTETTSEITTETTQKSTPETTSSTTTSMDDRTAQNGNGHGGGAGVGGMTAAPLPFAFPDDDPTFSRRHAQLSLTMRNVAADLMESLAGGGWRNRARYLAALSPAQVETLLEWLWLWQLTARSNPYALEESRNGYGKPFAGLENVPGYIITQVRDGQRPELDDADRALLIAFLDAEAAPEQ